MEKNKIGKYLKYAIGEIILVVIGILIALQINNWNENRKTDSIRDNYYHQILDDFDKETKYIQGAKERIDSSIASFETYKEYVKNPNLKPLEIISAIVKVEFTFGYFSFNSKTIETLESTGDIKLIPKDIRNKLLQIKRDQETLISQQKGNDQLYLTEQRKAFKLGLARLRHPEAFQGINIHGNIIEIILILESAFGLKNYTENDKISVLNIISENIIETKNMINKELNK